jgi:hypothetical protein
VARDWACDAVGELAAVPEGTVRDALEAFAALAVSRLA